MCRYFEQQKKKFALDFVPHLVFRFSCRASKFVAFYSFVVACFCHGIHFGWFGSLWLFYLIPQLIHSHQPPNRTPIFSLSLSFGSRLTHAMPSIFLCVLSTRSYVVPFHSLYFFYCYCRVCARFPFFISVDYFVSVERYIFFFAFHIFHFVVCFLFGWSRHLLR